MKIKSLLFVSLVSILLSSCNTFKKFTSASSEPAQAQNKPDDYTVSGVTLIDYQIIEPIRIEDSTITVEVRKPGETQFRFLNKYEFKVMAGSGGGGVNLMNEIVMMGNLIVNQNKPVAPKGTQYRIRSILSGSAGSKGLY